MNKTKIITLAVCAVVGFSAHAQNLLLNGSFESPVIPSNTIATTIPTSWQGITTRILNGTYGFPGIPGPQDGQQRVSLGNDGIAAATLSQAFTITNPGTYLLNWYDSAEQNPPPTTSPYSVTVLGEAAQVVASTNLDAWHATPGWVSHSMPVTLSPGTYTLTFASQQAPSGTGSGIDNVSLRDSSDLLASIHVSAVDICWAGFTNQMYQVQYRTNLSDTMWFDFGSPVQGTGTNCVTDGINGKQQRFYRIIRAQ